MSARIDASGEYLLDDNGITTWSFLGSPHNYTYGGYCKRAVDTTGIQTIVSLDTAGDNYVIMGWNPYGTGSKFGLYGYFSFDLPTPTAPPDNTWFMWFFSQDTSTSPSATYTVGWKTTGAWVTASVQSDYALSSPVAYFMNSEQSWYVNGYLARLFFQTAVVDTATVESYLATDNGSPDPEFWSLVANASSNYENVLTAGGTVTYDADSPPTVVASASVAKRITARSRSRIERQ